MNKVECTDKGGHFYEPVYDEYLEKEFDIGNWYWRTKKIKQKICKKHLCSFCGHVIRSDE